MIDRGGKFDQRVGDFDGKGHSGFEFARSLGQALQIMFGSHSDLCQRRSRADATAVFHDWFDQLFAGMRVRFGG